MFLQHGPPRRLISDRGPAFSSSMFSEFINQWQVRHILASAEHPETNGLVEKVNGTLVATLAAFVNFEQNDWDQGIQEAAFAINSSKQSTTQITPFELVCGHENCFPWPPSKKETHEERKKKVNHWRKVARRLIIKKQRKSKAVYDRHRKSNSIYEPGDLVLISRKPRSNGRTKKFLMKFVGPYQVLKQVSKTCYKVEDLPANRRRRIWRRFNVHISQVRRFYPRRDIDWLPEEDDIKSQQTEPSGSESLESSGDPPFESSNGQQAESFHNQQYEQFESSLNPPLESSDDQQVEPFREEGFKPQQMPVPFISRASRVIRPRTNEHNFIYY